MARSMTGYGRAEVESNGKRVTVEVKSVNHRFLEVSVKSGCRVFELDRLIKKTVKDKFARGYFDISFVIAADENEAAEVRINEALLAGYMKAAASLSERYSVKYPPTLAELMQVKDLFTVRTDDLEADDVWPLVESALVKALDHVENMRRVEGEAARDDVLGRLGRIKTLVAEIKEAHDKSAVERCNRLKNRIKELCADAAVDEGRLAQEAAIMTDRADISEEVDRLKCHLKQVDELLSGDGPMGRKLEFFTQEINRESNTIGSKTSSADATAMVVEIKSELEKIREQAQNIE